MRRVLVTDQARLDIREVLAWTGHSWGQTAYLRYETLVEQALIDLGHDPARTGVHAVPEAGQGIFLYRIEYSRKNVSGLMGALKRARHVLIFQVAVDGSVVVIRCMHESMSRNPEQKGGGQ